MKKTGIFALTAAAALVLSACSGTSGSGKASASASGSTQLAAGDYLEASYDELKDGGNLTLPISELTAQMNPFQQDGTLYTSTMWYWYNPQLALFDADGTWHFNPDYFTDVKAEEKDGNTVVTYDIREEAKFNDGTPIDVKAFQNTWKSNNGEDADYLPSSTDGYERITSVEAGTSDKQVVVTFDGIYAWWQGLFNDVLHPAVNTAKLYNETYLNAAHPEYGAGPYKVKNYDPQGGVITFERNEKWWGPKGKLDSITYRQMESQASINAFKNGEIDATSVGTADHLAQIKGMENVSVYTATLTANYLMTLNAKSGPLQDKAVRKAIFESIDRSQLATIRFNGIDYHEDAPGSFLLFESQKGYEDNFSKVASFDPENAKKELDAAGWTAGSDGIRAKDGEKLTVNYVEFGDDQTTKNLGLAIQQELKAVGVDLQIDSRAGTEFSNTLAKNDFDMLLMGFSSSDPFGVAYFGQIYASDGLNRSGTTWEPTDERLKKLQEIGDPDEQIAEANKLEVEALSEYGIMPTFNGPDKVAVKSDLANTGAMGFAVIPKENIGYVASK
ncbi:ABC transporter family substrate-binding protein [Neoactinobaculum massilliense]|uniref:ABC transporter family substrate-binding protein n=1 Tax=Neoactinobaculum massilliense TaxID=2364794 RepID=UPI000F547110|nr:ABC transporter family substrate-binding protein [Neoactinobaculum massilliense]